MVQRKVTELEDANEERSGLPPRARSNSKLRRNGDERIMAKENLSVMDRVVLEQQKANGVKGRKRKSSSAGEGEGQAMGGPSRRQARQSTPVQAEKRSEPFPQRSMTPTSRGPPRSQPGGSYDAAEISSVTKGISRLTSHQSSSSS